MFDVFYFMCLFLSLSVYASLASSLQLVYSLNWRLCWLTFRVPPIVFNWLCFFLCFLLSPTDFLFANRSTYLSLSLTLQMVCVPHRKFHWYHRLQSIYLSLHQILLISRHRSDERHSPLRQTSYCAMIPFFNYQFCCLVVSVSFLRFS